LERSAVSQPKKRQWIVVEAMYQFAVDMGEENRYSWAAPQGVMLREKVFEKKHSAFSHQHSANIWWAVQVWVLHSRFIARSG